MHKKVVLRLLGTALVLAALAWPDQRAAAQTWRVGLQVGHWRSNELPDELARLRNSTGASAGGYREYEVSLAVAERAAGYLRGAGVAVDILPATVPPAYLANAFVALHSDGSANTGMSGFKIAGHYRDWEAATALENALRATYGAATGMRWDGDRITHGMRGYYALSSGRFRNTISTNTPGVIFEMGYLTNPNDRRLMTQQADLLGQAIANGVLRFLQSTPEGGWPTPPPLPDLRATVNVESANLRAGPGTEYAIVRRVDRGRTLMIEEQRGDWLKVFSYRQRNGERWIRRDLVLLERTSAEPPQDGSETTSP